MSQNMGFRMAMIEKVYKSLRIGLVYLFTFKMASPSRVLFTFGANGLVC